VAAPTQDNTPPESTLLNQHRLSNASTLELLELEEAHRLRQLRAAQPQGRTITVDDRQLLNLASNDYLGLSQHPKLIQAAVDATQRFGVGSGASRLVSGTQPLHELVEHRFAAFKHAEAALLLPTGYTANLAVLTTLAGADDLIVMDKLVHASLIDAARASEATVRTYPHLQLDRAEQLLNRHTMGRRFFVTDSVFSMDGDCADLPAMCELADRTQASLIIDEAHGTGILGEDGSGLSSSQGVAKRVYTCGTGGVVISTASKALGSLGGLITADHPVIDLIINKARPFIYSTAVPPAQAAAIDAALDVIRDEPDRRERLASISSEINRELRKRGWPMQEQRIVTPILPLIVGSDVDAIALAQSLLEKGFYAPAIRPPTVAPGQSRVRLSLRADLHESDVAQLLDALTHYKP
jgi:8-amino-7-oxononanoate synthase